jgi:hypothetical protein
MMRKKGLYCCLLALPLANLGCLNLGTTTWTPKTTETIRLDTTGLSELEVRTHNGSIEFVGQSVEAGESSVVVTKRAGARSQESAEEALQALQVFVEPAGPGVQRIGWRWTTNRKMSWSAEVDFVVRAPSTIRLDADTHNGGIKVSGAKNDIRLLTHNGSVQIDASQGALRACTHNGRVDARYEGGDIQLTSHNGHLTADLSRCAAVRGILTTHNGSVELIASESTSAGLQCHTHNGRVQSDWPLRNESKSSRTELVGDLGTGGGLLRLETHNGAIRIKKPAG